MSQPEYCDCLARFSLRTIAAVTQYYPPHHPQSFSQALSEWDTKVSNRTPSYSLPLEFALVGWKLCRVLESPSPELLEMLSTFDPSPVVTLILLYRSEMAALDFKDIITWGKVIRDQRSYQFAERLELFWREFRIAFRPGTSPNQVFWRSFEVENTWHALDVLTGHQATILEQASTLNEPVRVKNTLILPPAASPDSMPTVPGDWIIVRLTKINGEAFRELSAGTQWNSSGGLSLLINDIKRGTMKTVSRQLVGERYLGHFRGLVIERLDIIRDILRHNKPAIPTGYTQKYHIHSDVSGRGAALDGYGNDEPSRREPVIPPVRGSDPASELSFHTKPFSEPHPFPFIHPASTHQIFQDPEPHAPHLEGPATSPLSVYPMDGRTRSLNVYRSRHSEEAPLSTPPGPEIAAFPSFPNREYDYLQPTYGYQLSHTDVDHRSYSETLASPGCGAYDRSHIPHVHSLASRLGPNVVFKDKGKGREISIGKIVLKGYRGDVDMNLRITDRNSIAVSSGENGRSMSKGNASEANPGDVRTSANANANEQKNSAGHDGTTRRYANVTHTRPNFEQQEHSSSYSQEQRSHKPKVVQSRAVRRGYWNRKGDHLTDSGYIVYAPSDQQYPPELAGYPSEDYMDPTGQIAPWVKRPELPESLPRKGRPPVRPYDSFIIHV
ncbi:hypothetical protein VNI00_012674 [Paramarasmius palmivorus]|uniref:Uncharacterized protein n=1 Tax=Paramarasmius palmivorus TaxID=297713 RepID=A0AAW0C554_9AGAR